MRSKVLFLVCLAFLASCLSEKDYDFSQVTVTPTFAFPIAFGDVGLLDMITSKDSAYVKSYPDGLLYFHYTQTLGSTGVLDLFELPDNSSVTGFDLPPGTLPASSTSSALGSVNRQINLGISPERLTEALLKAGTLNFTVGTSIATSPPNLPIEANVTLLEVVHKTTGQPLTFSATNGPGSRPLQDYVLQMVDNEFGIRVDFVIKPHVTTFIPPGTKATIQLDFDDMEFGYLKGYLGDQVAPIPPQVFDISLFESSLKDASVAFVQPSLSLDFGNEYGTNCEVTFTRLEATKPGSSLPFQLNPTSPVNLNKPATMGSSAATHVDVANEHAVLNFGPEHFEYEGSIRINKGLSDAVNFLTDTSKLNIKLTTEIPIYGRVSGIVKRDTMEIDFGDIDDAKINSSSLTISASNEMPLDAYVQIYLADSTHQILDSLFATNETYIVKASSVDGSGDLVSPGVSAVKFGLDPERVDKLFESKYLILKAKMNTAKDANGTALNVKFRAEYRLKLHIGLLAQFKVTLK